MSVSDSGTDGGRIDGRVAQHFSGGDLVIDAGCGDGAPLDDIGDTYRTAVGFDISPARFSSRRVVPGAWSFVLADLNRGIPVMSESADAVHANQVIEHVGNPLHFAMEVHRVLRPGGVLVVMTPNIRYLPHIWRLVVRGQGPLTSGTRTRTSDDWDAGHIHFFTPSDLVWIARQAGFSEVRTRALIAESGRFAMLRRMLDRHSARAAVKHFLSGNTMLVAVK